MDAKTADDALDELVGHLSARRSLLAWTMSWCPDGDGSWDAIWRSTTNVKAMINVLVSVGSVRGARMNSAPYVVGSQPGESVVQLLVERVDGECIDRSARVDELSAVVRAEIPRPPLARIVEVAHGGV